MPTSIWRKASNQKQFHHVVGYYHRFDVFALTVNRSACRPATFIDDRHNAAHGEPEKLVSPIQE
jgi:hypothetical protein